MSTMSEHYKAIKEINSTFFNENRMQTPIFMMESVQSNQRNSIFKAFKGQSDKKRNSNMPKLFNESIESENNIMQEKGFSDAVSVMGWQDNFVQKG